jgi:LPS-assembly lipoprotein
MRRRHCLALGAVALAGCGFQLRRPPDFAFTSIAVPSAAPVAVELRRNLVAAPNVKVLGPSDKPEGAQVILDVLSSAQEKVVVGINAAGQVREFQLRNRTRFRVRTPQGRELIPETELLQTRDVSFNETAVLAKEAEEGLLYRDMQTDIVQQLVRRLAAIKEL